jgi:hypothetical protein
MVEDLIRRARRRFLLNEALAQTAFAAAIVVGGFSLLLIVGTRYMEWWTLAIFAVAGIAVGSYRVRKRMPGPYETAVRVDENAHLQDTLSTAFYFSGHRNVSSEFLGSQRRQAEATAGSVRLEEAVPFAVPKALYAMAALCILASALIALRFGFGHGLDLSAPLTQFFIEDQAAQVAKKNPGTNPKSQKQWMQEAQSLLSKLGMEQKADEPVPGDPDALEKALEQALQNPSDSAKGEKGAGATKGGQTKEGAADDQSKAGDPLDNPEDTSNQENGQQGAESKTGDKNAKTSSGKGSNSGKQDSLLSRLKDAVSNMLGSDKNDSSQQGEQSAKNSKSDGSKGQPGRGDQKSQSQADAQNGEPDANGQSGQQSQGKLNSKADTQPGQGGSGIGSQDGSKELKEAAQLKAMGKISEIIGQRAATVSGETSVEVQSGNQKLHTNYSNTTASHAETDGDVTRDEIPLALQAYVQQYFAEVRKTKPQAKTPAPQ